MNPDLPVSKMKVINSIVLLDYRLLFRAERKICRACQRSISQKPVVLTCDQALMQKSLSREYSKLRKALKETEALSECVSDLASRLNQVGLDFHPEEEGVQPRISALAMAIRGRIPVLNARQQP